LGQVSVLRKLGDKAVAGLGVFAARDERNTQFGARANARTGFLTVIDGLRPDCSGRFSPVGRGCATVN
jgi:hypothetical protein